MRALAASMFVLAATCGVASRCAAQARIDDAIDPREAGVDLGDQAAYEALCAAPSPLAQRACRGLDAAHEHAWDRAEAELDAVLVVAADPSVAPHRDVLAAVLETARERLGSLDARCIDEHGRAVDGASITIDAHAVATSPLGRPLRLAPGTHTVDCTHPYFVSTSSTVIVVARGIAETTVTLRAIDRRPVLEQLPNGDGQRIVGYGALGFGALGLVVGGLTLGLALDAHGSERESFFDVSRGTLAAGGVLAVVGVVLVLTAPSDVPASGTTTAARERWATSIDGWVD